MYVRGSPRERARLPDPRLPHRSRSSFQRHRSASSAEARAVSVSVAIIFGLWAGEAATDAWRAGNVPPTPAGAGRIRSRVSARLVASLCKGVAPASAARGGSRIKQRLDCGCGGNATANLARPRGQFDSMHQSPLCNGRFGRWAINQRAEYCCAYHSAVAAAIMKMRAVRKKFGAEARKQGNPIPDGRHRPNASKTSRQRARTSANKRTKTPKAVWIPAQVA